jgi:hypothetical protein
MIVSLSKITSNSSTINPHTTSSVTYSFSDFISDSPKANYGVSSSTINFRISVDAEGEPTQLSFSSTVSGNTRSIKLEKSNQKNDIYSLFHRKAFESSSSVITVNFKLALITDYGDIEIGTGN